MHEYRGKKLIIYGLGKAWELRKGLIESQYQVVGYSDSRKIAMENYIEPNKLSAMTYDYILISSTRYFEEIREELVSKYNLEPQKILSLYDIFGDFRNNQMIEKWIADKLQKLPEGKILLDAGAGECRYEPYCRHLKYIAQDFGEYHADEKWGGLHPDKWDTSKVNIICDIIDMPLESESVDVVLCSEVFEHLKNPILALKEFARVLKPGGELILTAPFCSLTHMAPYYFCNGFSKYWYEKNLEEFGFTINEIVANGNFFKYLCQELLRVDRMANRYCRYTLSNDENSLIMESMQLLSKLAEKDIGSSEILCFGHMIYAQKK